MRTKSIEAVVAPVSETVGAFLIRCEEAQLNGQGLYGMAPMADAVRASIEGLIEAVRTTLQKVDEPQLHKELPPHGERLRMHAANLSSSTAALEVDNKDAKARDLVAESAKGILIETTALLECFDDYEVREILRETQNAKNLVRSFGQYSTLSDIIQNNTPVAHSIMTAVKVSEKRIDELLDPWVKVSLAQARDSLKTSATLLMSAMKSYVSNLDDPDARDGKDIAIKRIIEILEQIEYLVKIDQKGIELIKQSTGRAAKIHQAAHDHLYDLASAITAGDAAGAKNAANQYVNATKAVKADARQALQKMDDPARKAELQKALDELDKLDQDLMKAVEYSLGHPGDVQAKKKVLDLAQAADQQHSKVERLLAEGAASDFIAALGSVGSRDADGALKDVYQAALNGDKVALEKALKEMDATTKKMLTAAGIVADNCSDPEKALKIRSDQEYLEKLYPQLVKAARALAANPNDANARAHLDAVMDDWEKGVARLKVSVDDALKEEDLIQATASALKRDLEQFEKAIREHDAGLFGKATKGVSEKVKLVMDVTQNEIKEADPTKAAELTAALGDLRRDFPLVAQNAKSAFTNPNDAAAMKGLQTSGDKVVADVRNLANVMAQTGDRATRWTGLEDEMQNLQFRDDKSKTAIGPDGSYVAADGVRYNADGSKAVVQPGNTYLAPDGTRYGPDGKVINVAADGSYIGADGVRYDKNGKPIKVNPDGTWTSADGLKMFPDGSYIGKDGIRYGPDGQPIHVGPDGSYVGPDGVRYGPDGKPVKLNPDGSYTAPDGTRYLPDGSYITKDGKHYAKDGTLLPSASASAVAPLSISDSEAKSNPIKAAAVGLKRETNKWDAANNPMVAKADALADKMAQLSEFAKAGSKKELIQAARDIAKDVLAIEKLAREIAKNCSDKRLKAELESVIDRIPTIARQLSILATVKAANPEDLDNENLLITSAQNLMDSVKFTLSAAQSADIRSMKTAATVVHAALKWKRKAGV